MAKATARGRPGRRDGGDGSGDEGAAGATPSARRYLVLLRDGAVEEGARLLASLGGGRVARASDFEASAVTGDPLADGASALLFERLGVAAVSLPHEGRRDLARAAEADPAILGVERERAVRAIGAGGPPSADYLRGYRDGVNRLIDGLLDDDGREWAEGGAPAADTERFTWGLIATGVDRSRLSGRGVGVAVLDTGLDLGHPDFAGRTVEARSFVGGEGPEDGQGHGTHCVGTACGPREPAGPPRYGTAFEASVRVGKVLNNQGAGGDVDILSGIEWAINAGCAVISMSLGAPAEPGRGYSAVFERVGRRALGGGCLIVAAAGNESRRPGLVAPVGHPANCPSILAVGALDRRLRVAAFSSAGLEPEGGQVDLAAPGVAVRSSWPRPELYRAIDGTSMATPHVAGLAALHAEADPGARGEALWNLLIRTARRLDLPARDVGAGLARAP